ncbi:glutathione S-transferase family protein [Microcoleus sp. K1-B6]|uniref:glutathione S-transferase family protein n=1 Tax=unclassified Microcoleus TaxID=2642155 RepID=UPI002FD5725B
MKLYYIPTTRAVRPRWCLEEMGIVYELVKPTMAVMKEPEYRKLHPHGKVPVLIDGDVTIFESAAICAYLADRYPEKELAPALSTPARGYYYQWLFYAVATLEPPVEKFMFNVLPHLPEKLLPKKVAQECSAPEAQEWFDRVSQPLTEAVKNQDYLVENQFTIADIVAGGVLVWALKLGMLKNQPILTVYTERLMARPAFQQADEDFYAKVDS